MHYVVIAEHSPEVCPTSNAKTRALMLEMGPQVPKIAEKHGVTIVSGPYVNREHITVAIVETDQPERLDDFLVETRLHQWNRIRIIPSMHLAEGMRDAEEDNSLF